MGKRVLQWKRILFMGIVSLLSVTLVACSSDQTGRENTQQDTTSDQGETSSSVALELPHIKQGDSILTVQDDIVLRSLRTDEDATLSEFLGKPLVLGMWATWCPHCRSELLVVKDLLERNPEANIVMVNLSKDKQEEKETRAFLKKEGLEDLPIYFGNTELLHEVFEVEAFPTTYFIDAAGTVVERKEGTFTLPEVQSFL